MTVLVTGGAGFIGSNFIRHVLGRTGFQGRIVNFDALTYAGNPANIEGTGAELVVGDICDETLLDELDIIEQYQQPGHESHISELTKKQVALYMAMDVGLPT